jgi:hypothetical protein
MTSILRHRHAFELTVSLDAAPRDVWREAGTLDGYDTRYQPMARSMAPTQPHQLKPSDAPRGGPFYGGWTLLLGLLPIDKYELTIHWYEPPHGYHEDAVSWLLERWVHIRQLERIEPEDETDGVGCLLRDQLAFTPRHAWTGRPLEWLYRWGVGRRQSELADMFGRHDDGER